MQNTFTGENSLPWGSRMCTGTLRRNLNPDSLSQVGEPGEIDWQPDLVLCGNRGESGGQSGRESSCTYLHHHLSPLHLKKITFSHQKQRIIKGCESPWQPRMGCYKLMEKKKEKYPARAYYTHISLKCLGF